MKKKQKKTIAPENVKLPHNYRELYWDSIKQNWQKLLLLGLFTFFSLLPTLAVLFFKDYYTLSIAASSLEEAEKTALKITAENLFNAGAVLAFILSSIGFAGISRVNLLLSREEGVFLYSDFRKGVKQNLGSNALFFTLYGLLLYAGVFIMTNFSGPFLPYLPLGIVQGLVFPLVIVNMETTSIYSWKMGDRFYNSVLLFIKNFLVIVAFDLVLSSPFFLFAIPNIYVRYIVLALILLFVLPFVMLLIRVYFNYVLDRDINKENYPEIYKKGIFPLEGEGKGTHE